MRGSITRRTFVLGTASAAVLAGLAGCMPGQGGGEKVTSASPKNELKEGTEYYKSAYAYTNEDEQRLVDDEVALGKRIVHEGVVLLRNEGAALPLSPDDGTVMVFGNAGTGYMTGLDEALANAGFDVDAASWEFYANGSQNVNSWQVNENPWSDVENAGFLAGASGVALVFLGRRDREGCDAQWYADHDYLALSQEEKDLLEGVAKMRRAGTFSKMVVAVTTSNTISWEDGPWTDAVDALLWFGNVTSTGYDDPLSYGTAAFVDVLDGTVNPSGRMADTIYKDNQANPVMANFGRIDADLSKLSEGKVEEVQEETDAWKPSNDKGNHWRHNYVYAEGIYVGYRYPETRYEDKVLGQGNAGDFDYDAYVAYPFGSGLSYTTFSYSDFSVEEGDDAFEVTVSVTNEGSVAGKTAVCAYVQSPYTDYDREHGIEKASVELKGYAKTELVEPGASASVSIVVCKRDLASFDANEAKTYILDDGDYFFTVADSAHAAINNILAAKGKTVADGMTDAGDESMVWVWSNPDFDDQTFSVSVVGTKVTSLFDEVDPNKNELINGENSVTWLSRSDWEGTFPTEAISLVYTDALADLAKPITYQAGTGDAGAVPTHEFGKDSDIVLVDMRGKDYDDPDWERLVSRLSYEEMAHFVADPEAAITKIGKPRTIAGNGSQGWATSFTISGLKGMEWPSKETLAATFSTEINEKVGELTGENLLHSMTVEEKNASLYGWSCNVHRAPYSGRNLEYFSEDPYLGGRACAEETKGIVSKGGLVYVKHFAGNDQEEYRHGVPSWANEQALREIYLRQFEKAIVDGKANGAMSGFNRLGMKWTGESRAVLVDFLEGELGYRGTTITDQFEASQMDVIDGLLNGSHVWLGTSSDEGGQRVCREVLLQDDYKGDPVMRHALFEAVHRALYNYANSLSVNGLSHDYEFVGDNPLAVSFSGGGETGASAPTSFYGDKTFMATTKIFWYTYTAKGTWDYTEDEGLSLTLDDGTKVPVSAGDDGLLAWEVFVAGSVAANLISRYEIVSAYNAYFGTKHDAGIQPSYTLSFVSGSEEVSGDDPKAVSFHRGEAVKLPDCPYAGEHLVFGGWSIDGSVHPAGSEYVPNSYADLTAEGTWSVKALAIATTLDGYIYSSIQPEGIPMVLYADGTVEVSHFKGYICEGTWKLEGSGAGSATLSVLNESGAPIAIKGEGSKATYAQEGVYYDWNQPEMGYGSGMFLTMLTHTLDLDAFVKAYNEEFGTSYDSVTVEEGTAAFALVESGEPKSTF